MRSRTKGLLAVECSFASLLAFADVASLPSAELDSGGLTYEFDSLSERLHQVDATTNYFAGFAWQTRPERIHLFGKDLADDAPVRKAVSGFGQWRIEGHRARLDVSESLLGLCGGDAHVAGHVISECHVSSALPDSDGGDYELCFRYAASGSVDGPRESYWMVGFADRPGASWQGATWHPLDDFDNAEHEKKVRITVPKGMRSVDFAFEFSGMGSLDVKAVSLTKCKRPSCPISIRNSIPNGIDGVFALSEGQVGLLYLEWQANDDTEWDAKDLRMDVKLPKEVSLRACSFADLGTARRLPCADGGETWRLEAFQGRGRFVSGLPPRGRFDRHRPHRLLLEPKAGCGEAGVGEFSVTRNGECLSNVERIRFRIIPRVKVAAPKRLLSGMNVCHAVFDFNDRKAQEALAQLMADAGMRTIHWPKWQSPPGCDEGMIPALRKAGFTRLMPYDCSLSDGYLIGEGSTRPADERFVGDIKTVHIENASCPVAIYTERPHVLDYFTNALPRIVAGADGLWANWEPYFFAAHGCWCDRCRAAFTAYSGLPAEVVAGAWPNEMKKGRYEDVYIDFRAKEHAKVVKTVDKWVRKYTGGENSMGFVPGVAWCEMGTKWRALIDAKSGAIRHPREQSTREYASGLAWMNPWGPYPRWDMDEAFSLSKCKYLVYWTAAKDVREQVDRDYWSVSRPSLLAYPSGRQGGSWISQPEELAMAFDAFYVNGWRGVVPYFFPMGYDARYWAALAAANARAAKYEDWFIDGQRSDASVAVTPVPEYAMPCDFITSYVPTATNVSMLQTAAFRRKGVTIVAALNYWTKGEAFFVLRVRDLPEGRYAIVDEAGVLYMKSEEDPLWSASELARQGPLLMVGSVRTRVFEVRPADEAIPSGVSSRLTVSQMAAAFSARRPRLAAEAAKDAAEEKARRAAGRHPPET